MSGIFLILFFCVDKTFLETFRKLSSCLIFEGCLAWRRLKWAEHLKDPDSNPAQIIDLFFFFSLDLGLLCWLGDTKF